MIAMSCYWDKARTGRAKALETLAARRMSAGLGTERPTRGTRRSPLAQALYAAELESRTRTGLVH
jgi:hypothetical protein